MHIPVLLHEVVEQLQCARGGRFIDVTLGGGGHAKAILAASPHNQLFGIDRDSQVLATSKAKFADEQARVFFAQGSFAEVVDLLSQVKWDHVDGILADLGVSSFQLDEACRGFSFRSDGPLDMRMDSGLQESAADWVASASEQEMIEVFRNYGEERFAKRIAAKLCKEREHTAFEKTSELARAIVEAYPPPARRGRIHPATRVFQAIRIHINDELGQLRKFLEVAPKLLKAGGRLAVISYHSLEDRLVKHTFRDLKPHGFSLPFRKPIVPTDAEIEENRRARSAKLRVLTRDELLA